jgi:phosphoribosylformylglycinamidine synthase
VAAAIAGGAVRAAHDVSDGGLLVAAAEMAIAGDLGVALDLAEIEKAGLRAEAAMFGEEPGRYLLEVSPGALNALRAAMGPVPLVVIGRFEATGRLKVAAAGLDAAVSDLAASWTATLDW